MSSSEFAVEVESLSKCYHIYNQPQDRLKQSIFPRLQVLWGKAPQTYFHKFWALRDVSFEVKKGETVGIIGRNGSGKSTLLQLICGTLTPTGGFVRTRGRIAALLELGSGFNSEFTGYENIYLNGTILGLSKDEIDSRFDDIASFADIGEFIEQPIKMYSSGMVVRLAFAIQAMVDPDILIVDEALAVGDEKFQRKCFARLEELKGGGTSILFVSHSVSQIMELCDWTLLLEHGERLMYGSPSSVINAYQKLIYAPLSQQPELVKDYKFLDQSLIDSVSGKLPSNISLPKSMEDLSVGRLTVATLADRNETQKNEAYDSRLVPDSTVVYPVQGAEIHSIRILDAENRNVNLLSFGKGYRFEVSGKFLANRENVYFGLHIRTISGLIITGQRYPEEGKYIDKVYAGDNFAITYAFKMVLSPDTYFSGGGIWSLDEPHCLHRILDAVMFRVLPERRIRFLGYVDVSSTEPVLKIG